MLGYDISDEYIEGLKADLARKQEEKERRREKEAEERAEYQDENFYFIAGFTSGGAPYGCTWESLEDSEDPSMDDLGKQHFENIDDNEVPF
ncbi:MAG: hypothetical protein ACOX3Q_06935 [Clostridia bacterium]|jgi:hypothetical protein